MEAGIAVNVCGHAHESTLATKRPMHKYDVYPAVALWLSKQNCSSITSTAKKRNRVHGTNTPTQNMSTYALKHKASITTTAVAVATGGDTFSSCSKRTFRITLATQRQNTNLEIYNATNTKARQRPGRPLLAIPTTITRPVKQTNHQPAHAARSQRHQEHE